MVSSIHTQVQLDNDESPLGACNVFDVVGSSNLGLVPLGGSVNESLTI